MLHEKVKELEKDTRLLNERNKQIHALDRDLAIKEDTIHKLLAEMEQAHILADQVNMLITATSVIQIYRLMFIRGEGFIITILCRRQLCRSHCNLWR